MTMHTMAATAEMNDLDEPAKGWDPAYLKMRKGLLTGKPVVDPDTANKNNIKMWLQLRNNYEIEEGVAMGRRLKWNAYMELGTDLELDHGEVAMFREYAQRTGLDLMAMQTDLELDDPEYSRR